MIDLSIVIVSYNTRDLLINCLESIYKNSGNLNLEIIVVDNASSDGTVSSIKNYISSTKIDNSKLIENKKNLGFSKANNIGVKQSKGKYVLFLNPDTVIYENTLEGMVRFMESNKDAGAATCKVLMPSEEIDDASHRGFPTPWNAFTHFSGLSKFFGKTKLFGGYNLGYMDLSKTHEIDALAGAFMMVRRKAGEEVGWWDEDYFFYGEDLDFCYLLKQKGWKIYYVPEYSILHYKGVSGGIKKISEKLTSADSDTRKKATEARFNAMRIFYKKHYEKTYPKFLTKLVYLGISLKQTLSSF